jgi:hypothetical protein
MKKDDIVKDKIKKYSVLAGAVLTGGAVNAQIQYTDMDPDIVIDPTNSPYLLDLNGDSVDDITFAVSATSGAGSSSYMGIPFTYTYAVQYAVAAMAGGGMAGVSSVTSSGTSFAVDAHDFGAEISDADDYSSSAALGVVGNVNVPALGINQGINEGAFLNSNGGSLGDKYLGYSLSGASGSNYGWIRLSVADSAASITIKSHAINTVVDQSIYAGNAASVSDVSIDDKVSIVSAIENVKISVPNELLGGDLSIIDMTGKTVSQVSIENINTLISTKDFNTGIYIVRFTFNSDIVNKRIYIR